jgi:DNA replication protein DnaC
MRTTEQAMAFRADMLEKYIQEPERGEYYADCYEACIPRTFWDVTSEQVHYNKDEFQNIILKYTSKLKVAMRHGYSLLLTGDNGAGKTMFMSFIETQALRRGWSAYYTTLTELDANLKRGFNDREADRRLQMMLDSDILAIDEVGKEYYKSDSWLITQLERILKSRFDNGEAMLLGTNVAYADLLGMYGSSIESMLEGKYHVVPLSAGDYRKTMKARMAQRMGL